MSLKTQEHVEVLSKYLEEKKLSEALDYLEVLPQEERNCWEIENLTGVICSYCGQFTEAVSFFRRALKHNAEVPEIYYNLADAYVCLQKYQQAEIMLKQCEFFTEKDSLIESVAELRQIIEQASKDETKKEENNVLMIAYYFPPLSGSGVFRSLKFAKYLPEMGWNPTVISSMEPPRGWNYRDDSMVNEIPESVDVIRIVDEVGEKANVELTNEKVNSLIGFLRSALYEDREAMQIFSSYLSSQNGVSTLFQFPCSALIWAWEVVNYIERNVDLNKFKAIYTTSGPSSSHLVGFYLKKKYGIPWIADYRDPWILNPYAQFNMSNPIQRLLFLLERNLLKNADCNIVVDGKIIDKYCEIFGIDKNHMVCITNGYDEQDFSNMIFSKKKTEKFTVSYSGLLYTQQRSMAPILKAIMDLCKEGLMDLNHLKIQIVGQGKELENSKVAELFGLSAVLEQTGYVSHAEAIQADLDADMLLLFVGDDPKFKITHTGKIFEYLRSGTYILALAPKDGAVDEILVETGQGTALLSTQMDEIKEVILQQYRKWLEAKEKEYWQSSLIRRFDRKYLTMQLTDLLLQHTENGWVSTTNKTTSQAEISDAAYNELYVRGGAGKSYHKHYKESFYYPSWKYAMKYLLLLDRNTEIFEIACGVGQFANFLFDTGFKNYKGFDFAAEGVKIAKESNPEHQDKFFVADAFETPEVAEKHDLVICFEMLEHINKDLELLSRIPSGTKLLLSVPNFDDPNHVRYFLSEQEVYDRYSKVVNIFDISRYALNKVNCLYYIVGEKR